jgi:hypothetical protein
MTYGFVLLGSAVTGAIGGLELQRVHTVACCSYVLVILKC